MRLIRAVVITAVALGLALVPTAAFAEDPSETLVALTNETRAADGAAPVVVATGVQTVAQAWADHLAATGDLVHNPDASAQLPEGWSTWGENIASGAGEISPATMNDLWNGSAPHRANIVNPAFTVMGVGYAVAADGTAYGVELFAGYEDPARAAEPPAVDLTAPVATEEPPAEAPAEVPAEVPATAEAVAVGTEPSSPVVVAEAPSRANGVRPLLIALVGGAVVSAGISVFAFLRFARSRRTDGAGVNAT